MTRNPIRREWWSERPQLHLVKIGVSLVALLIVMMLSIVVFWGAILNHFAKTRAERTFAKAYPGFRLEIGHLDYSLGGNCLIAQAVTLSRTNATLKVDRISLMGIPWTALLWGTAGPAEVLPGASFDASNLDLEIPQARYGIRCGRMRSSVPKSDFIAEGIELWTLVNDEEFFAAHDFRTTRFHMTVPECIVTGLAYDELFAARSYRARSVHFLRPSFDALVDLDKLAEPFVKSPLMVHEALAEIQQPLQIDSFSISDGSFKYSERVAAEASPAVLTVAALNIVAEGIANHGDKSAEILLRAQGNLMEAGMFNLLMSIPIMSKDLSLSYSGSINAMELTNLDAFLDTDAHTRIKSGSVKEAAFDVNVAKGHACGHVRAIYQNLEIALLNKRTDAENGIESRFASLLANTLEIRNSNPADSSGRSKEGEVSYTRKPDEEFQQFLWFALRTGILDIIRR